MYMDYYFQHIKLLPKNQVNTKIFYLLNVVTLLEKQNTFCHYLCNNYYLKKL